MKAFWLKTTTVGNKLTPFVISPEKSVINSLAAFLLKHLVNWVSVFENNLHCTLYWMSKRESNKGQFLPRAVFKYCKKMNLNEMKCVV